MYCHVGCSGRGPGAPALINCMYCHVWDAVGEQGLRQAEDVGQIEHPSRGWGVRDRTLNDAVSHIHNRPGGYAARDEGRAKD